MMRGTISSAQVIFLPLVLALRAWSGCLPVTGDRILGRDLALAYPAFSALPSTLPLGYTPVPGTPRVFTAAELQRLARSNGISGGRIADVCFEVPLHVPADADFTEAMSRELPQASTLQLTDRSRQSVPQGKIEFPLSGLEPGATGSNGIQLWRGYVQYTETRRVPLWARVIAAVTCTAVVARQDLAADVPLATAQLRVETRTCPLNRAAVGARLEDVIGRVLLHSLKAGAEIPSAILEAPTVVRRGESVEVEVQSGLAVVRFDAVAQASARAGEIAELRNPINGRIFHARISAGSSPRRATALIILGKGPAL